ncbi:MAG: transposase [Spirochaetaceae bacterium]|nr:transposase [Spirochaetaceae bacterium]
MRAYRPESGQERGAGNLLWQHRCHDFPLQKIQPKIHRCYFPAESRIIGYPAWRAPEGIFSVLRTGIRWKAPPKEYGAVGGIRQYFSERAQAGFFMRMRQEGPRRASGAGERNGRKRSKTRGI